MPSLGTLLTNLSCVVLFSVLTVLPSVQAADQIADPPLPPGGVSLLPADPLTVFGIWGKTECGTSAVVEVTGQPFTRACRITTLRAPENQWEVQYGTWIQQPIKKGDVILVRMYVKAVKGQAETGEAKTKFGMSTAGPEWASSMSQSIGIPKDWKLFSYPFVARHDTPVNGAIVAFDMGFSAQAFDIGGIQLINYGNSRTVDELPRTRSSYAGEEELAPWRAAAKARIEQVRKADLAIRVTDASGKPLPNCTVSIEMKRHAFAFGSAVAADTLVGSGPDSDRYRGIVLENYTATPIENHLKWPFWEGWGRADADRAVTWLTEHGINKPISGPLVWGGWTNLPEDLKPKQADHDYLLKRINDNIPKQIGTYASTITDWEVVNEPFGQNDLWKIFGYEKMADFFHAARRAAPKAHLTINDYPSLDGAAVNDEHLNAYYGYVDGLLKAKAPVDGLGFQCHFGSNVVPPERVLSGLDRFAKLGLPISITEFDMESTDEDLQRRYMRDFMTAAFSHPSVDAILMWGFWEGKHWLPTAALYRMDWSIKPNGQAWLDLVKRDWWTRATEKTNSQGDCKMRGFLGAYAITVQGPDGTRKTVYQDLTKTTRSIVIAMDGKIATKPTWLVAQENSANEEKQRRAAGTTVIEGVAFNLLADKAIATSSVVDVSDQKFTQATRFIVVQPTAQAWEAQALMVTNQAVRKGERVTLRWSQRSAPGAAAGKVIINFQTGAPDYKVLSTITAVTTPAWQSQEMNFTATDDIPTGKAMLVVQLGLQAQTVEVGGVKVISVETP